MNVDFTRWVRPGETVWWGQGTSEPLGLTEILMAQRARIGSFSAFIGASFSQTLSREHGDHVAFSSYCAVGTQTLWDAGALDVLPCHLSQLPFLIEGGALRCDVALVQLSPPRMNGRLSVGVSHDYLLEAASKARVVIAEVNEAMPWTYGADEVNDIRIDHIVSTDRPVLTLSQRAPSEIERRVAFHAAELIPDRAVLQTGVGGAPDAIVAALHDRRDLGVHSGMIGDGIMALIEKGVVNNAFKTIDRGVTITGMLAGSQRLYAFADRNPLIQLRPVRYTHSPAVTSRIDNFYAINSALEVDLSGQINAEMVGSRYVGAIGGQVDFMRGAMASKGGRSIIALPSTAANGARSRIVPQIETGIVTTPRSDADLIVTEWGVADLRGQPLTERARRLIAIAHPQFRESLEKAAWQAR